MLPVAHSARAYWRQSAHLARGTTSAQGQQTVNPESFSSFFTSGSARKGLARSPRCPEAFGLGIRQRPWGTSDQGICIRPRRRLTTEGAANSTDRHGLRTDRPLAWRLRRARRESPRREPAWNSRRSRSRARKDAPGSTGPEARPWAMRRVWGRLAWCPGSELWRSSAARPGPASSGLSLVDRDAKAPGATRVSAGSACSVTERADTAGRVRCRRAESTLLNAASRVPSVFLGAAIPLSRLRLLGSGSA